MNAAWVKCAAIYADRKPCGMFYLELDWILVEIKYREKRYTQPYREKYNYVTDEEIEDIEKEMMSK